MVNQIIKNKNANIKPDIKETLHSHKNSVLSFKIKKINCFELKNDYTNSNKTMEFYLNYIFKKKKLNFSKVSVTHSINLKTSKINGKENEEDTIVDANEIPFNYSEHHISPNDEEILTKLLKKQVIFQNTPSEILSIISSEMFFLKVPEGKIIYDIDDDGNFFYIISKGKIIINIQNGEDNTLKQWDTFGELSLFVEKKRNEIIITKEYTELYGIDSESFRDIQKRNNENILKERFNFLNNISIFECLDKISKYNVAQKLKKVEFKNGEKIITKGEKGHKLYIIKEGIVSCRIGFQEIRRLNNNEYFGQNAILIDAERGADIYALQKCICYELSKEDLKEALTDEYVEIILFCFFKNSVENNITLKSIFIESAMHEIFKCFKIVIYKKHEKIYDPKSNDNLKSLNKKIVIIIEGSLFKSDILLANKGKIIGEELFNDYNNYSITEDIMAYPDCITLEANIEDIAKIMKIDLGKEAETNLNELRSVNKLKKLYLFKTLSEQTLKLIAKNMKKQKYKPGEYIVEENTYGDTFYLISKGRVQIIKNNEIIRELDNGDCFGENVLLTECEKRTASAKAFDKVICYVISKKEFDIILSDGNTKEYLLRKLALQDTNINLSDLHYIKFLGQGKFGSVSLVHNHKNIYAIKAISRKSVEKEKMLAKYFVNEKKIMLSLDHPFIIKMVKSMKNKYFCFLLIEYINGKNLDEYLSGRNTKQNIYETQFYIASMLLMLDYLQKKFIAHRDIKPSNIMIDSNGYLKMIDFGTAKILTDYTSTIIGTPHYIAPEILQGKGYSLSCDFWSVGICLYEIFYGIYPFGHYANEVVEIYKDILKKDYSFPCESMKTANVNALIKDLLNKKVNERVCNVSKLKRKAFFDGFEFDKLNDFKLKPPYKPDKINFEKFLSENNPYELKVQEDNTNLGKKKHKSNEIPPDYDPNWADQF